MSQGANSMRSVLTFWQLSDDEEEFIDFAMESGDVIAVPHRAVSSVEELTPQPLKSYVTTDQPGDLLFGLRKHFSDRLIETATSAGQELFLVRSTNAPLIAYDRGKVDGVRVTQSNLCAYWKYLDNNNKVLLTKDDEFIRWAKRVLKWMRNFTAESVECNGYPYPATKRVKEAVVAGKLEAILY